MILVFGGTTEGRTAAGVLEEAGKEFFYSTVSGQQDLNLTNGKHINGRLDRDGIIRLCAEKGIRLLIDAGHPFAEKLHEEVRKASEASGVPAINYERIYEKPLDVSGITSCENYEDAERKIIRSGTDLLLAFTGVNSISQLKGLETKGIRCIYRIADREESRKKAKGQHVNEDNILFLSDETYETQMERAMEKASLYSPRHIAVIMKESGKSGGFMDKIEAARKRNLDIYVLKRKEISGKFYKVDGPNGLRLMVERLLPEFFPLHIGISSGTCATAAALGALKQIMGENPERVPVVLPNGETIMVDVEMHGSYASAIKYSGDDPDVTDGIEIRAEVRYASDDGDEPIRIIGGKGVGRITLPGFDYPIGEAAINKVPREMIVHNLRLHTKERLEVEISVPDGERIASKTFNPRLGIEGGISIIGVSGIVRPFSEESFISSINKCLKVARASGDLVVINSGAKSERYVKGLFPSLPTQCFVEYGNYVGKTISMASEMGFRETVLVIMIGKAVKLAAGNLDTHSKIATMDRQLVRLMAERCLKDFPISLKSGILEKVDNIKLTRELWEIIPKEALPSLAQDIINRCHKACEDVANGMRLEIILLDNYGNIYK